MAGTHTHALSLSPSLFFSLFHTLSLSLSFTFANKPLHTLSRHSYCPSLFTISATPFQVRRGSKMELSHWSTAIRLSQSTERSAYAMSGNVNFTPEMKGLGPVQLKLLDKSYFQCRIPFTNVY